MSKILSHLISLSLIAINISHSSNLLNYCSHPGESLNKLTHIPTRNNQGNFTLKQVHIINNSGSRLPLIPSYTSTMKFFNFESYQQNHCQASEVSQYYLNGSHISNPYTLSYDGSPSQVSIYPNCRLGQLVEEAWTQFETFGESLHTTYFSEGGPLGGYFDSGSIGESLYYRSIDSVGSMLSGQLLIEGALKLERGVGLVCHTNENYFDHLNGNYYINAYNYSSYNKAVNSRGYGSLNSAHRKYYEYLNTHKVTGIPTTNLYENNFVEGYTTAVCGVMKGDIPYDLQVNSSDEDASIGNAIFNAAQEEATFLYTYGDSSVSKDAIHNFMLDFKSAIHSLPDGGGQPAAGGQKNAKFLVYSTNRVALMMFLSSLGPGVFDGLFPPFAASLIFEVYSSPDNSTFFRIIYKGEDITQKIPGCSPSQAYTDHQLCELQHFLTATQWASSYSIPPIYDGIFSLSIFYLGYSTLPRTISTVILTVIITVLIGLCIDFLLKKKRRRSYRSSSNYRQF